MLQYLKKIDIPLWVVIAIMAMGYLLGLFVELPDNDSANHASISIAMIEDGKWFSLMDRGLPYLDKPHFQFWLVAASFLLLGIGTVAYKISSLIFTILALWATFKLTKHLCDSKTATYATLIVASMAAFALANVDVRMDAILTATIIIAVWQGVMFIDRERWIHAAATTLAMACAFGTKGWIGAFVPAISIVSYLIWSGKAMWLLRWRIWIVLALFAIFISPLLYAYYLQFDLHPELVIRGTSGHSGVKFILWDQVFGRMGGQMGATGSANDHLFYLHTLLWAALPWSFLFYFIFVRGVFNVARKQEKISAIFALCVPAIVLTTLAFSLSKFKLPHYINIIFPLMAIMVASALTQLKNPCIVRRLNIMQKIILFVVIIFIALLNLYLFAMPTMWGYVVVALLCVTMPLLLLYDNNSVRSMVVTGALFSGILWTTLNSNFYPQIATYQAGAQIARLAQERNIAPHDIGMYKVYDYCFSFDVYNGCVPPMWWDWSEIEQRQVDGKSTYLYLTQNGLDELVAQGVAIELIGSSHDYRITRLNARFMNPRTRPEVLSKAYLVKVL